MHTPGYGTKYAGAATITRRESILLQLADKVSDKEEEQKPGVLPVGSR